MRAIIQTGYGSPDTLEIGELDAPVPGAGELLVRVHATGVNPGDWDILRGTPYIIRPSVGLRRPKNPILGLEVAGVVVEVGEGVTSFSPGDEVFAEVPHGGFADYVIVAEEVAVPKPVGLSFEEAAVVPVAGVTALQGLRDAASVQPGQTVLVNGASGGVGTFAVQVAKALGGEVTGVCGAGNVEMVRSIGADHVVDYAKEDFADEENRYDVILDNVGNRAVSELRRALAPKGTLLPNSNKGGHRWVGAYVRRALHSIVLSPFVGQRLKPFAAKANREDLLTLLEMIHQGELSPVIDTTYPLESTAQALTHYGAGHTRGKIAVTVAG